MKQGTTFYMPIDFGIDLELVKKVEFMFSQDDVGLKMEYPSERADTIDGSNYILLLWKPEDTYLFDANRRIKMDTRITLKDSIVNPETTVQKIILSETLFREGD